MCSVFFSVKVANLMMVQHIRNAEAVTIATPGLEHVEDMKQAITELCALITPEQVYPRGYRWPSLPPSALGEGSVTLTEWDETHIRSRAKRLGYDLAKMWCSVSGPMTR